jgi:hypothetical protein
MRLGAPAITCVAILALQGCGGDGRARSVTAPPVSADGTKSGLGPARFKALDDTYSAAVAVDGLRSRRVGANAYAAAARPLRRACVALNRDDALLAPLRLSCLRRLTLNGRLTGFASCIGGAIAVAPRQRDCVRAVGQIRALLLAVRGAADDADRAVQRSGLVPVCRDALTTPTLTRRFIDAYARTFDALGRALRTESRADLVAAGRLLGAATSIGRQIPPATVGRDAFRAGCG